MWAHTSQEIGRVHWEQGFVQLGVIAGEKGRKVKGICGRVTVDYGVWSLSWMGKQEGKRGHVQIRCREGPSEEGV